MSHRSNKLPLKVAARKVDIFYLFHLTKNFLFFCHCLNQIKSVNNAWDCQLDKSRTNKSCCDDCRHALDFKII